MEVGWALAQQNFLDSWFYVGPRPNLHIMKELLPTFNIEPQHIYAELNTILRQNRTAIKKLLSQQHKFTWNNLIQPLEELNDRLHNVWSVVENLHSTMNNEQLRAAYQQCLPKLSSYYSELGQNKNLYQAIASIAASNAYKKLDGAQKQAIQNELRDFKLSGVNLSENKRDQFKNLQKKLTLLANKFSNNVMDATYGWNKLITDKKELSGIHAHTLLGMKNRAKQQQKTGWLIGLDQPTYLAVMTYADSQTLREEVYRSYVTRASNQGPNAKRWDNHKIMENILAARAKLAHLVKYPNYAEYSLAPKAAPDSNTVIKFINKLARYSKSQAQYEYQELQQFAKQHYQIEQLQPWDLAYYSEKLQQHKFSISEEELRPYFPLPQVLSGLFKLAHKLFAIKIEELTDVAVWHPEVKVFAVYNSKHKLIAVCYMDLYARAHKQNGAWMHDAQARRKLPDGSFQLPIAYIVANFQPPVKKHPALLTHSDVETLFHEFGHALQHMLTKVDYAAVSGINGVPWDVVELPSQFMENWCWQKPIINMIGKHYQTGKKLPNKLFNNMLAAKNFQSGMQMMRQLEFALFDMQLHCEFKPQIKNLVQKTLDSVRKNIAVIQQPAFNKFQNSFLHIFAGGYAAGYYSYKWAEVLSADAFAKFEEDGLFNKTTGALFLENILAAGGSDDAMRLFKRFRGRAATVDALLEHSGIRRKS